MKVSSLSKVALVGAILVGALVGFADDKPKEKTKKAPKLVQPWSLMSSLSDDQKTQIIDLHQKANDEVNAIRDKEKNDIMALLSDEQKKELEEALAKKAAEDKARKNEKESKGDKDDHDGDHHKDGGDHGDGNNDMKDAN